MAIPLHSYSRCPSFLVFSLDSRIFLGFFRSWSWGVISSLEKFSVLVIYTSYPPNFLNIYFYFRRSSEDCIQRSSSEVFGGGISFPSGTHHSHRRGSDMSNSSASLQLHDVHQIEAQSAEEIAEKIDQKYFGLKLKWFIILEIFY